MQQEPLTVRLREVSRLSWAFLALCVFFAFAGEDLLKKVFREEAKVFIAGWSIAALLIALLIWSLCRDAVRARRQEYEAAGYSVEMEKEGGE